MSELPSQESLDLIRESVLLPALLKLIRNEERTAIENKSSMQRLFVRSARQLYKQVEADLFIVRRELGRRRIQVSSKDAKPPYALHYFYQMKDGFCAEVAIFVPEAKEELGHLLAGYIKGMFVDTSKT